MSIRGAHRPELERWRKLGEKRAGAITIGVYENPSPAKVLVDLLDRIGPGRVAVSRVDAASETPCAWQRGAGQPGGLAVPQGRAVPGDRFVCTGGGYVGLAVLHAVDHQPHLCLFATPLGGSATLRIRFANVTFAESLHGHDGVQWVDERVASGDRITLAFHAFDRPIGEHVHRVGVGWVGFEFPTSDIAGKNGELVADVSGGTGQKRYCFEADVR